MLKLLPFTAGDVEICSARVAMDPEGLRRMAYYADASNWYLHAGNHHLRLRVEDENGELIGFVDLELMRDEPAASFAYYILPGHRGLGLASVLLVGLTDWVREHTHVNRLAGYVEADNQASSKALDRANFAYDGLLDGMRVYRLNIWR